MSETFDTYKAFTDNLDELRRLTREEYPDTDLDQLISQLPRDELARMRLARLLGVQFKEPFGMAINISPETSDTRARRAWNWDQSKFDIGGGNERWQYQILTALYEKDRKGFTNLASFADWAAYEKGIGKYLLESTKKFVCSNKETRDKIETTVKEAKILGKATPQSLIAYAGGAVSTTIIASAPFGVAFAAAFAPVAGVITIYILSIGLDAFCSWSEDYIKRGVQQT
jgi:hypothetical protein